MNLCIQDTNRSIIIGEKERIVHYVSRGNSADKLARLQQFQLKLYYDVSLYTEIYNKALAD